MASDISFQDLNHYGMDLYAINPALKVEFTHPNTFGVPHPIGG